LLDPLALALFVPEFPLSELVDHDLFVLMIEVLDPVFLDLIGLDFEGSSDFLVPYLHWLDWLFLFFHFLQSYEVPGLRMLTLLAVKIAALESVT